MLSLRQLHEAIAEDITWGAALEDALARGAGLHLAVFVEPYLRYILEGRKTIESRFSIHRAPPFGQVRPGDILTLKGSAGAVVGIARISHVWTYRLSQRAWDEIRQRFGAALCLEDESAFVSARRSSRYATLMRLCDVRAIPPMSVAKRDRRGWVVIESSDRPPCFPGFEDLA